VDAVKKGGGLGFMGGGPTADYNQLRTQMLDEAKRVFKPEFLNRFDDIVVFRKLTREDVSLILDIELGKVRKRLENKGHALVLSRPAMDFILDQGFSESMGARPLRRTIEKLLEDPLAEDILRGRFESAQTIEVTSQAGKLAFRQRRRDAETGSEPAPESAVADDPGAQPETTAAT
jgi:ATP-dependent Clp protease ATP-binding subunit ClpC